MRESERVVIIQCAREREREVSGRVVIVQCASFRCLLPRFLSGIGAGNTGEMRLSKEGLSKEGLSKEGGSSSLAASSVALATSSFLEMTIVSDGSG